MQQRGGKASSTQLIGADPSNRNPVCPLTEKFFKIFMKDRKIDLI